MAEPGNSEGIKLSWLDRITVQEKIDFSRHLSIVIKAGLPIVAGLKILRKQAESKTMARIIDQLALDLENGQSLSTALKKFRSLFGDFFISIVAIGETSGTLANNLLYVADEIKKRKALQSKVRSAMIYPAILMLVTIGVSIFLVVGIFPKIIVAFTSLNVELPLITVMLITTLNFLQSYGIYLLFLLLAAIVAIRMAIKVHAIRFAWHVFLLRLPVIGRLMIDFNVASLTHILGVLLKSGIRIVEALQIVAASTANLVYRESLLESAESVRTGGALGDSLAKHPHTFPVIMSAMVEVGENTGNLEDNLIYLADYYAEEVDTSLKNMTALLEPIILVFMGIIVGFVALAIVTPIYSITQGIK